MNLLGSGFGGKHLSLGDFDFRLPGAGLQKCESGLGLFQPLLRDEHGKPATGHLFFGTRARITDALHDRELILKIIHGGLRGFDACLRRRDFFGPGHRLELLQALACRFQLRLFDGELRLLIPAVEHKQDVSRLDPITDTHRNFVDRAPDGCSDRNIFRIGFDDP